MQKIESGMHFKVCVKGNENDFHDYYFGDINIGIVEVRWKLWKNSEYYDNTYYPYHQVKENIDDGSWVVDYKMQRKDKLNRINQINNLL